MRVGSSVDSYDAVVIGGGFYGCCVAVFEAQQGRRCLLVEKEEDLLTRASYVNQARVHNGYHYPRSFITALRSAVNFPRFVLDFSHCINDSFEKIYAIARQNSRVNAHQFLSFCKNVGVSARPAPPAVRRLFSRDLIEEVFVVREYAFNAALLREIMRDRLSESGVELRFGTSVSRISRREDGLQVNLGGGVSVHTNTVFNCTYSQLNTILQPSGVPMLPLKHEIAEMAMIEPPEQLQHSGVTIMDGPFFSTMPFPALGLYSLSHVRYTPHESWQDAQDSRNAHEYLQRNPPESKYRYMIRDAERYIPCMRDAKYVRSLFEVKTVLVQNEVDDGRPILMRRHAELGNVISIMGGKIDNIYDILAALRQLQTGAAHPETVTAACVSPQPIQ